MLPLAFAQGTLRRLSRGDLAAFQAYRADPELGRYQAWSPMSDGQADEFLAEMSTATLFEPGAWVQLGIAAPDGGRLLGDIGLFVAEDRRHAEIGFTLERAAQGRGLATEAVRRAVELVLEATPAERVLGITDARNEPSIRLLQRVGMQRAETRTVTWRGEPCVEHVFQRLRDGLAAGVPARTLRPR